MKRFKIGEDVVALTNPLDEYGQPRVKGKVYPVLAVKYCSGCGGQKINIAGTCSINFDLEDCGLCRKTTEADDLWWTDSNLFARPQELQAELEVLESEEKYEECAELVKIMAMIETA